MNNIKNKIIIISSIIIVFGGLLIYKNSLVKTTGEEVLKYETRNYKKELVDSIKEKDFTVCNYNILKPEIAFVYQDISNSDNKNNSLEVGFYNFQKENLIFGKWNFEYTGGTTISNTTFSNLLKMVKEDCSQFQKDSKDIKDFKYKDISWGHREYDAKAEEQKELQKKMEYERLGIKKYKSTEENLKKVEKMFREHGGIPEEQIQEVLNDFKSEEYFEIDADL